MIPSVTSFFLHGKDDRRLSERITSLADFHFNPFVLVLCLMRGFSGLQFLGIDNTSVYFTYCSPFSHGTNKNVAHANYTRTSHKT